MPEEPGTGVLQLLKQAGLMEGDPKYPDDHAPLIIVIRGVCA